jgi:hypothetical protein
MGATRFPGCHDGFSRGRCRDSSAALARFDIGIGHADSLISLTAALMQRFLGDTARDLAAAFACLKLTRCYTKEDVARGSSDKDEKGS